MQGEHEGVISSYIFGIALQDEIEKVGGCDVLCADKKAMIEEEEVRSA